MENKMFCFQCEQTAKGTGCTVSGVCGKVPEIANLQDDLTSATIKLAKIMNDFPKSYNKQSEKTIINSLFVTVTNVNFTDSDIRKYVNVVELEIERVKKEYGLKDVKDFEVSTIWKAGEDERSLKSLLLFGLRGMSAYAHHAEILGRTDKTVSEFFYKALNALTLDLSIEELLALNMEFGLVNLKCMELLDEANTGVYGTPEPTKVTTEIEAGPFIIVTGHDLHDIELLLKQTEGKGVNIYTHGEMLPTHSYPELKKYSHLKGNFGTAWQNQQKEFEGVPAPVLFTTNCIMPVKKSYADRIFTTSLVGYPEMVHIDDKKDFSVVIAKALELGGYSERQEQTGINGGKVLTTGFGHGTVISVADKVVGAVKDGKISRFFLVGGCDGAAPGRNYYTDFVKQTPEDSIILTLACGKFRFNDLDLGDIAGLPRIMDMGQCNDSYSAIRVALALSEAFECGVNDLPLTLVLSWYEQKAVCVLLTLLALGIENILLGPTLPAFLSPNVINILVEKFKIAPITTPEADLARILA